MDITEARDYFDNMLVGDINVLYVDPAYNDIVAVTALYDDDAPITPDVFSRLNEEHEDKFSEVVTWGDMAKGLARHWHDDGINLPESLTEKVIESERITVPA